MQRINWTSSTLRGLPRFPGDSSQSASVRPSSGIPYHYQEYNSNTSTKINTSTKSNTLITVIQVLTVIQVIPVILVITVIPD